MGEDSTAGTLRGTELALPEVRECGPQPHLAAQPPGVGPANVGDGAADSVEATERQAVVAALARAAGHLHRDLRVSHSVADSPPRCGVDLVARVVLTQQNEHVAETVHDLRVAYHRDVRDVVRGLERPP